MTDKEEKERELKEKFLKDELSVEEYKKQKNLLEEDDEEEKGKNKIKDNRKMSKETKIGWGVFVVIILAIIIYGIFSVGGFTGFVVQESSSVGGSSERNVQEINMVVDYSGYTPNSFVLKKGIPVKWNIDVKELTGCNSNIISKNLNLNIALKKGKNIIEFTPNKEGTIDFSCSMGMLRGSFVVTDSGTATQEQVAAAKPAAGSCGGGCGGSASCGGTCGGSSCNINK